MSRIPRWAAGGSLARVVLSRLDGSLDVADIAALTGTTEEVVEKTIEPLVERGLVVFGDVPAADTLVARGRMSMVPPGITADGRRSSEPAAAPDALTPVTEEEHHRVTDLYLRLNRIDHYRLLGVAATTEVKAIKRSYYALAKLFHPDRFFRKDVGALRPKIDAIFSAMTSALDTLTDPDRRASYDSYLRDVLRTRIARRSAEGLEAKGEFAAAAEVWERVLEQLPMDAYVQHRYAYALLRGRVRGAFSDGIDAATRAIELDPTRAEYRVTAASLYIAAGRERSALSELDVACELEADRIELQGLRAAVAERIYGSR